MAVRHVRDQMHNSEHAERECDFARTEPGISKCRPCSDMWLGCVTRVQRRPEQGQGKSQSRGLLTGRPLESCAHVLEGGRQRVRKHPGGSHQLCIVSQSQWPNGHRSLAGWLNSS